MLFLFQDDDEDEDIFDESGEDEDDYDDFPSGESHVTSPDTHPVVFRWKGAGNEVFLSGSYDKWQTKIPLAKRSIHSQLPKYCFQSYSEWIME